MIPSPHVSQPHGGLTFQTRIIKFCDNHKKPPLAVNRLELDSHLLSRAKTRQLPCIFRSPFASLSSFCRTHMLNVRPDHIAAYYTRRYIKVNIGIRRRRKVSCEKVAVKARARKVRCRVAAHMAGLQTTDGEEWRRLSNTHAGTETTWRERAELENRGVRHFTQALRIHDIMRRRH